MFTKSERILMTNELIFIVYLGVGLMLQFDYILTKLNDIKELEYFFAKVLEFIDIILGVLFFPIYVTIEYLFEIDIELGKKWFRYWQDLIYIFLFIPVFAPLKIMLIIEIKFRKT